MPGRKPGPRDELQEERRGHLLLPPQVTERLIARGEWLWTADLDQTPDLTQELVEIKLFCPYDDHWAFLVTEAHEEGDDLTLGGYLMGALHTRFGPAITASPGSSSGSWSARSGEMIQMRTQPSSHMPTARRPSLPTASTVSTRTCRTRMSVISTSSPPRSRLR